MKKTLLTITLFFISFNLLNAQNENKKEFPNAHLNQEKLKEGKEKLNIFLYEILGEMKTELEKQQIKLKGVSDNDGYSSEVEKEKKTLKILNKIKEIELVITEIRNRISNEYYTKSFQFQKTPEGVVHHIFNSFINSDFSKFDYLADPYGEYDDRTKFLNLISVYTTYLKSNNPLNNLFEEDFYIEIINSRIKEDKAFVLVKLNNTKAKNYSRSGRESNEERLFTLVNRKGNWYLIDIAG